MPLSNRLPLDPVNLPQLSAQHVSQETFKIRPTLHKTTARPDEPTTLNCEFNDAMRIHKRPQHPI
jgi:hypothetical protein